MFLTRATFDTTREPIVASFVWDGQLPRTGAVLWQVVVHSKDRQSVRRLGYKIVDAQPSAQFVWDEGGAWQATPEHDADLEANRLTARFNPLALHGMGNDWTWEAVLSVDGQDLGKFQP
ncbi:hypothetical protein GCM10009740_16700 [Terrabacter terrae]|uniref:Uncharacterized protein n=1 Tax=Terrabacter terrae TaxID=318434 RepID=A0ABP5FMS2_9MICO